MAFEWANWPTPAGVFVGWTTRQGGVSSPPFGQFNVARHVGDHPSNITLNRTLLQQKLPGNPVLHWLNQTHSTTVVHSTETDVSQGQDGVWTDQLNQACVVMTADCLPVFLWANNGDFVAAIHAGWRGLAEGIVEQALAKLPVDVSMSAGLGPAIQQAQFEVGPEVQEAFRHVPNFCEYFVPGRKGKLFCDLAGLATAILRNQGVENVYDCQRCTAAEAETFYSYRRDGQTGRQANLIWRI